MTIEILSGNYEILSGNTLRTVFQSILIRVAPAFGREAATTIVAASVDIVSLAATLGVLLYVLRSLICTSQTF